MSQEEFDEHYFPTLKVDYATKSLTAVIQGNSIANNVFFTFTYPGFPELYVYHVNSVLQFWKRVD